MDLIAVINIALCFVILSTAYWIFKRTRQSEALFIGLAFTLFGITHIITLFGLDVSAMNFVIVLRIIAYIFILLSIYKLIPRG